MKSSLADHPTHPDHANTRSASSRLPAWLLWILTGSTLSFAAHSADLSWVGNGTTFGGSGNWSSVANTWSAAAYPGPVALTTWDATRTAVFSGAASPPSVVTIADPNIDAQNGLRFEINQFTLSGGSLTLTGASSAANPVDVAAASMVIVDSVVAGSAGITKTGAGTLVLGGVNTYSGETVIEGGMLAVSGSVATAGLVYVGNQNSNTVFGISGTASDTSGSIGVSAGAATNQVQVASGGIWTNSGDLNVGYGGVGNMLHISIGGVVNSANGNLAVETGSSGNLVTIADTGSAWNNSGELRIGYAGSNNTLTVSAGGAVNTGKGVLGLQSTSTGNQVVITGVNSTWANTGQPLYVGYGGSSNTFLVESGAHAGSSVDTVIGELATSDSNALKVKDAGSLFTIPSPSTMIIGGFGSNNTLDITNGAVVAAKNGRIGRQVGADDNIVTVAGTGSAWNNSDEIRVGMSGVGNVLTVKDGSSVTAARVTIARNTGSGGTVNIGAGGASGTLTGPLTFGDSNGHVGTGVLNFNHTDAAYPFSNVIAGPGTVRFIGNGTTILSGANTYSGTTDLVAGTLRLGADNTVPATSNLAFKGGTLAANDRSVTLGMLSLENNSTLSLGDPTNRQDVVFGSAAAYVGGTLAINGWDGPTGSNYDRLIVTADPTASGILSHIQFSGYPIGASWIVATGEIVPSSGPIVVAATAIPTLSPVGMAIAFLLLCAAAMFSPAIRRKTAD